MQAAQCAPAPGPARAMLLRREACQLSTNPHSSSSQAVPCPPPTFIAASCLRSDWTSVSAPSRRSLAAASCCSARWMPCSAMRSWRCSVAASAERSCRRPAVVRGKEAMGQAAPAAAPTALPPGTARPAISLPPPTTRGCQQLTDLDGGILDFQLVAQPREFVQECVGHGHVGWAARPPRAAGSAAWGRRHARPSGSCTCGSPMDSLGR